MSAQTRASARPDWPAVWRETASRLQGHWDAGRGHLLTEDTLRLCLIEALGEHGVGPDRLAAEVLTPGLPGAKLDLTIDGHTGTVVELKYPRDSRTGISPDTMTFGELLRDFCRVGLLDADDRWVVQVLNARFAGYLANAVAKYGLEWPVEEGERVLLDRAVLAGLPRTALNAIGSTPWRLPVSAACRVRVPVAEGLDLFAYQVEAPGPDVAPAALDPVTAVHIANPTTSSGPRVGKASGARAAILEAIDHLTGATGRGAVTIAEVVARLKATGSPYKESTIRTMMTSHMCVDAQGAGIGSYDDLERLGRGEYRRRQE